jgi:hypothetical protein
VGKQHYVKLLWESHAGRIGVARPCGIFSYLLLFVSVTRGKVQICRKSFQFKDLF